MDATYEPYITQHPGDAITAEDNNQMQIMIKEDIDARVQKAVDEKDRVANADNADKLEQKTLAEIAEEIIKKALAAIPKQTGYRQLLLKLEVGEEKVVEHALKACPLVDLYQLDYFKVGASEDGYQFETWVNFYIYHSTERRLRFKDQSDPAEPMKTVDIELTDSHPYKIPFVEMLERYGVEYTDDSSLGDLENEFWKAFFAAPNDKFDDDQQAHSPWFDRCCRENMSVKEVKRKRDWDDIWFQMRPRKSMYFVRSQDLEGELISAESGGPVQATTQVEVTHFNFNTLGMRILRQPVYPPDFILPENNDVPDDWEGLEPERWDQVRNELKVMALLKV